MPPILASTIRRSRRGPAFGLTLVELLITLAIVSILAAMLIPQMGHQVPDQLLAVSEIVVSDLDYARSLAVVNGSKYEITFTPSQSRYVLRHSGTNTLLHALPHSAFRLPTDPPDAQTTDLTKLPLAQPPVLLHSIVAGEGNLTLVSDVEFTSLGGTTRTSPTVIWLACGSGPERRFVPITISAATGLAEIGDMTKTLPAGVAALTAETVPLE